MWYWRHFGSFLNTRSLQSNVSGCPAVIYRIEVNTWDGKTSELKWVRGADRSSPKITGAPNINHLPPHDLTTSPSPHQIYLDLDALYTDSTPLSPSQPQTLMDNHDARFSASATQATPPDYYDPSRRPSTTSIDSDGDEWEYEYSTTETEVQPISPFIYKRQAYTTRPST